MKKQAGFTIIELVMVIVILGILSAFALPRFANVGTDARAASLAGVAGAMRSAAAIAHAQQLVDGDGPAAGVTLEGEGITMVSGYPTADAAGIILASGIDIASYDFATSGNADPGSPYVIGYTGDGTDTCTATYTAANLTAATAVSYNVTIVTGGC